MAVTQYCFNYALEYLVHPLAFVCMTYRYVSKLGANDFRVSSGISSLLQVTQAHHDPADGPQAESSKKSD